MLEEMGRALLCAPYFSTVALAANTLLHSGDDAAKKELLPGIASRRDHRHAGVHRGQRPLGREGITMDRAKAGDGYTLDGHKMFVLDGHTANLILVGRPHGRRREPVRVEGDAVGSHPHAADDDGPDPQAGPPRVRGRARQAHRHRGRRAGTSSSRVLDLAAVALAAEQVGGAQKVPRHVGRVRQGARAVRPSHRLVPGHQAQVRRHAARGRVGQVGGVLRRLVRPPSSTTSCRSVASLAKAYCSEAYFHASAENIQIHGGIGFTWEHDAHLYFKRAKSSELLFGDPTYHRELLAQRIGI